MGSHTRNFFTAKVMFFKKHCTNKSVFYFTTSDKVNRCSGRTNSLHFIGYQIKIIICRNFDVQIRNAEILLENRYDSSTIQMVGISETLPNKIQILLSFLNFSIMIKSFSR